MQNNDLQQRLFQFAIGVITAVRTFPRSIEYKVISYQLIKSATSVGANYEEAQGAVSKADFSNKIGIALKEIRESVYWIKIVIEIHENNTQWKPILKEAEELKKIMGSIYSKTSTKR